jgi:CubicO group peptidase (beta-lactamase class C family)
MKRTLFLLYLFLSFYLPQQAQKASDCLDLRLLDEYIIGSMRDWNIPGRSGYGYSNIMFLTAGEIIPVVEQQSWDDFLKNTFFDPLGMKNTTTTIRGLENAGNVAHPHYVSSVSEKALTIPYINWDNIGGAGAIMSNVHDMSQWILFQLNDGNWNGKQIISEKNIWEIRKIQNFQRMARNTETSHPSWHFRGYGMGWAVRDYHGTIVIGHGGEMYDDAEVTLKDNQLTVHFLPTPLFEGVLTHWQYDIFRIRLQNVLSLPEGTVRFIMGPDGKIEEMKVDIPNPDFDFTELTFNRKN